MVARKSSSSSLLAGVISLIIIQLMLTLSTPATQAIDHGKANTYPLRKSIVFDLKTPKVFYCPQEKPSDSEKMIVKSRPLDKLCEFQGQPKPKNTPSDCYNDVDETEFACDEKRRFMVSDADGFAAHSSAGRCA
jgi:hypothetical protein